MPANVTEISSTQSAMKNWAGVGLVVASTIGFSTSIIFTRLVSGMEVMNIAFFRSLVAFLFFCAFIPWHPEMLNLRAYRPSIKYLIGLGCSVGATCILYIYALRHTTAANSVLLNNTAVVYVVLLAPLLLKEVRPRHAWLSLSLAILGILLITDPTQFDWQSGSTLGIVAAFFSGITYAFVILFGRLLGNSVNGITQTWWSTGVTALLAAPSVVGMSWEAVVPNIPYLIALGIIALGVPYLFFFLGLQRINAQVAGFAVLLEPVLGVLIGISLYQEIPTLLGFLGIGLILSSIFLISQ